jgi:TrmH family RNA methyltransferase
MPLPIRVILVRPRDPNNIGACARALGNFGLTDLVVVDPYAPVWRETRAAPDAEPIIRRARKTATLKQALRGCTQVLGTSSFAHCRLEHARVPLPKIAAVLSRFGPRDRIALVFGSERSGLSNEELSQCEAVIHIPMSRPRISMNLAQAVAVVLYEITKPRTPAPSNLTTSPEDKEAVINLWTRLAEAAGYPPGYTAAARTGRIRQSMKDVELTPEAARFLKSFSRWLWKKL